MGDDLSEDGSAKGGNDNSNHGPAGGNSNFLETDTHHNVTSHKNGKEAGPSISKDRPSNNFTSTAAEYVLHENYLLMSFVQNLSESYMGRKYMINSFLVDLYTLIRKKVILSYMIDTLKKEKSIPAIWLKRSEGDSSKVPQSKNQSRDKRESELRFDSVEKITQEDSVRYIETPKHLKKLMKGRKPDESKMDCILGKTDFLEELTEKQRLAWVSSISNEDLLKYYSLAESSQKNTYMKFELTLATGKNVIAVCKIPKLVLSENPTFYISQRTGSSLKRKYDPEVQALVSRVERSKIFNYTKPHTQSTLFLKGIEKRVNGYNKDAQKTHDNFNLFRMLEELFRSTNC